MYGKVFDKMYEGSMVGIGPDVFALWGYCIAKANPDDHTVELNPLLLSCIIGMEIERVLEALDKLLAPDPSSHSQEANGARLTHVTGHRYHVTTHEEYRGINDHDSMKVYMRDAKRKQRSKGSKTNENQDELPLVKDSQRQSKNPVSVSVSVSEEGMQGEKKADKTRYGEFKNVRLTAEEYEKLKLTQGEIRLKTGIEILGDYKEAKGKAYKSDYATMKQNSWVWERVNEAKGRPPTHKPVLDLTRPSPRDLEARQQRQAQGDAK